MTPFQEYVDALLRLRAEMGAGRGDEDAAESIRDDMDGPWDKMTDEERALARRLSTAINLCTHG